MAKKAYVGIANLPKNVSDIYVGVNNAPKKVIKGYVGVNGVPMLFYEKGGEAGTKFWLFYETLAKTFLTFTATDQKYNKTNIGIAFFAAIHYPKESSGRFRITMIIISTDIDAVAYSTTDDPNEHISKGSVTTASGDKWYYAGFDIYLSTFNNNVNPDCYLSELEYTNITDATNDLLDKIYADDFAEDYNIRTTYTAVWADREKTIRKALAIWLYKNYSFKGYNAYDTLLANLDTIINRLLTEIGSDDLIQVYFGQVRMTSNRSQIAIFIDSVDSSIYQPPFTIRPATKYQAGGYTYFRGPNSGYYLQTARTTYAYIEETNIRYISDTGRGYISTIGVIIIEPSQYRVDYGVILSNLGLNL